jgi:hypothetical protein
MYHTGNPNAFLNSVALPREVANRQRSEQDNQANIIKHTFEIDTGYFLCREDRFFYPYLNYEVVQIRTTDRNASMPIADNYYILNFPIDQLSERLVEEAIRLNPRRIALCNPLSSEVFLDNYGHILEMTLNIFHRIVSLTKITLCVDILNEALFCALRNQLDLREVEILLPSSTSPAGLSAAHIVEVLNRGYALADLLPRVEFFTIPLDIARSFPATATHLTLNP